MPRNTPPFWIWSATMFPMALAAFVLGMTDIVHGARSRHWPVVEGQILSSNLGSGFFGSSQPVIRYLYPIEGKMRLSNRLWPGTMVDAVPVVRAADARFLLSRFPVGARVPVYINPARSDEAILLPGAGRAIAWTSTLFLFLSFGIGAPILFERFLRSRRANVSL